MILKCVFEGVTSPCVNLLITFNHEVPNCWKHCVTFSFTNVAIQTGKKSQPTCHYDKQECVWVCVSFKTLSSVYKQHLMKLSCFAFFLTVHVFVFPEHTPCLSQPKKSDDIVFQCPPKPLSLGHTVLCRLVLVVQTSLRFYS